MARLDRLAPVKEVAQIAAVHRPRVRATSCSPRSAPLAGRRARGRARPSWSRRSWSSAAARRPRRPTPSSTRWCRTPPTRACSRAGASSCTPGSRRSLEERFPEAADGRARAAGPPLRRGRPGRAGGRLLAPGGGAGRRALGQPRGDRALRASAEAQLRTLPPSAERSRAELEVQLAKGIADPRAAGATRRPRRSRLFLRACELCEELGDRRQPRRYALRGCGPFYYVAGRWPDAARVADRTRRGCRGARGSCRAVRCAGYVDGATRLSAASRPRRSAAPRRGCATTTRPTATPTSGCRATTRPPRSAPHLAVAEWLVGLPERAARTSAEAEVGGAGVGAPLLARPDAPLRRVARGAVDGLGRGGGAGRRAARDRRPLRDRDYVAFGGMLAGIGSRRGATRPGGRRSSARA